MYDRGGSLTFLMLLVLSLVCSFEWVYKMQYFCCIFAIKEKSAYES